MASAASTFAESPIDNTEKPNLTDSNDLGQTVQYDLNSDTQEGDLSRIQSRRQRWKDSKGFEDGQKPDWWFACTAIPLLAATLGPLANVLSIAALVTPWRETVFIDGKFVSDFEGKPFTDPRWCYWINAASLICGFVGNFFLLLNFTQRIRYLIALPVTIILWYFATGFLIAITSSIHIYAPPIRPQETYTQGFWYGIVAACIYLICSMILMINMLGYFLGHYPDTFALTDAQRTLILQTMLFFIWLAGGGGVFSRLETEAGEAGWSFSDALYFCDVTILTVGFGDLYPTNNVGRGLVFPFSVGGIVMLGLVISAIYKFMQQLGHENIVKKHVERVRTRTVERTVTNSIDLRERQAEQQQQKHSRLYRRTPVSKDSISSPSEVRAYRTAMGNTVRHTTPTLPLPLHRTPKIILLREEKDRFEAMRRIQASTSKFKKWYGLTFSVVAFGILWGVGAVVFWQAEKGPQGMTYFQALYFCYVSLLTIGYGDLSPKSNAGRCFFVVWSLIAVPTMTILISDMSDTVVSKFKNLSDDLADFTVLPKEGIWRSFLEKHPKVLEWIQTRIKIHAAKKRLKRGFDTADPEQDGGDENGTGNNNEDDNDEDLRATTHPTLPELAIETEQDASGVMPPTSVLARRLALSIRRVASDLKSTPPKKYSYEEWVEFTRLIRWTKRDASQGEVEREEEEEGLVDWDWIGEDSPMLSGLRESEWLLGRLCESLVRIEKKREISEEMSKKQDKNNLASLRESSSEEGEDISIGGLRNEAGSETTG